MMWEDGIPRLEGGLAVKAGDEIEAERKGEEDIAPSSKLPIKVPE